MPLRPGDEMLRHRSSFNPQLVLRRDDFVVRDPTPWTPAVHALLKHLEAAGIEAPRVAGNGYDEDGMETLTYVEGEIDPTAMFTLEGSYKLGALLRKVHTALASFSPTANAVWFPWCGRSLGRPSIIGHCDLRPWNIVRRGGPPVALIDWTRAGPVDPIVELAHACWLNAHLLDDAVAKAEGLPSLEERARHLRAIVDGYGLERSARESFVALMIDVVVLSAADDVNQSAIGKGTVSAGAPPELVWALSWQIRGAAWQIQNRERLTAALL
jgi:hypothetical protein